MKKITLSLAVLLLGSALLTNAGAAPASREWRREKRQERRAAWSHGANPLTLHQFQLDYPAATLLGWKQGEFREASFMDGGLRKTAFYDNQDESVGTSAELGLTDLPSKAREKIERQYAGYSIEKVILYDDNEANDEQVTLLGDMQADRDNYFALLRKDNKEIILEISPEGELWYFSKG